MSLGGVEFAEFSGPMDADVEARLNGEYLWGRHLSTLTGSVAFASRSCSASKRSGKDFVLTSTLTEDINIDTIQTCLGFKKSST